MATQVKMILSFVILVIVLGAIDAQLNIEDNEVHLEREKRMVPSLSNILGNFQNMQTCCAVPTLIPRSAMEACSMGTPTYRSVRSGGFLGQIFATFGQQRTQSYGNNYASQCYADCVFKQLGLLNVGGLLTSLLPGVTLPTIPDIIPDLNVTLLPGVTLPAITLPAVTLPAVTLPAITLPSIPGLNSLLLTSVLTSNLASAEWKLVVTNAIATCQLAAQTLPTTVVTPTGRICSTFPLRLMVCLRRLMILDCPAASKTSACAKSYASLRRSAPMLGFG